MAHSIRVFLEGIKGRMWAFLGSSLAADVAIIFVVLLVGVGAFGLGRLSMQEGQGSIAFSQVATTTNPAPIPPGGQLAASRSGTKYYYPWCGGVKTIKDSNLIWFDSQEKARAAGYTPAANCKGLSTQ